MKRSKIIVWGTGTEAKKLVKITGIDQIAYFADNNEKLRGKEWFGKRILSMEEFLNLSEKYLVVISSEKYEKDIANQLLENGITYFSNAKKYRVDRIFDSSKRERHRIILLNTHDNVNIGDYLITIAELYFFRKYMPDYELLEIPLTLCRDELEYIHNYVKEEDLLVITGGGFLGSLWLDGGEMNVRKIVRQFKDNRIVVFPQTMFFEENAEGEYQKKLSQQIYNSHKNLTFCFRDERSYRLGEKLFDTHVMKKYVPDLVTILDRSDEIFLRNGVLMCIREDKERVVSEKGVEELESILRKNHLVVRKMTMLIEKGIVQDNRMDAINAKLCEIQKSRLVITDRLHCMLLCAISGTPCIAFDNLSGKVSGSYQWVKENTYVQLAEDKMPIEDKMRRLLNMPYKAYKKEKIEREFEKLAEFLESGKA